MSKAPPNHHRRQSHWVDANLAQTAPSGKTGNLVKIDCSWKRSFCSSLFHFVPLSHSFLFAFVAFCFTRVVPIVEFHFLSFVSCCFISFFLPPSCFGLVRLFRFEILLIQVFSDVKRHLTSKQKSREHTKATDDFVPTQSRDRYAPGGSLGTGDLSRRNGGREGIRNLTCNTLLCFVDGQRYVHITRNLLQELGKFNLKMYKTMIKNRCKAGIGK